MNLKMIPGFVSIGGLLLFWAIATVAIPMRYVDEDLPVLTCDPPTRYTTEWFLQHVKPEYTDDFRDKTLFYTRRMTKKAIDYADTHGFITLWHVWPSWLYREDDVPENPLQCIHKNSSLQKEYYENMARAFAIKANGVAVVMHAFDDYDDPPLSGIWGMVELEAVKGGAKVDCLAKMKEDGTDLKIFWQREAQANQYMRVQDIPMYRSGNAMTKRDVSTSPLNFLRPDDYAFFDANA